jgi:hypothetical protein
MYLGVGIGNGTLTGLALPAKMIKANKAIAPATGINSVAEGLGMGLTSSIVGSINVSSLLGGATDPSTSILLRSHLLKASAEVHLRAWV